MSTKVCKNCSTQFEITNDDLKFYDKISPVFNGKKYKIPEPSFCPDCRQQRRLSFRNERSLHYLECAGSGKKILSMYDPKNSFTVYDNDFWWSDHWDGKKYGQDFDLSQQFFLQFQKLYQGVPKIARIQQGQNENSSYCNCASYNRDCYLLFSSNKNEKCMLGTFILSSNNCIDNFHINHCELCYECTEAENCYNSRFLLNCKNCSDSSFLKNCIGCKNCFGSMNLQNKEYYFLNKKYSKEEYEKKISEVQSGKDSILQKIKQHISKHFLQFPHRFTEGIQNQNSSGDHLSHSNNSHFCWTANDLEDCKFCSDGEFIKTSYDVNYYGSTETNELLLECEGVGHGVYNVQFSKLCWGGSKNLAYCWECFKCEDCFGSTGLKNSQYCILNKQYTREEYEKLVPKIIEHMKKTGEWGEFFPSEISPFAYNETVAQEYFPRTKEEVLAKGLPWKEEKNSQEYMGPKVEIPDSIEDVDESICKQILKCEVTGKLYKITPQELKFYKQMKLPIPRKCPDQRHKERMSLRNPRKLFERNCDNCNCEIQTTYDPKRPEKVFCEKCYLESVY